MSSKSTLSAIKDLYTYMISEDYKGYDPYDTLLSPLFRYPLFNTRIVRFGSQQVGKRVPVSFRKILRVPKGLNPVTAGLSIQAYSYLLQIMPENQDFFHQQIEQLLQTLLDVRSKGFSGSCWGYDFDWEARFTRINAYVPTSVATCDIANGLFENFKLTGNQQSFDLCQDATQFILNDLNKSYDGELFCYSYSPVDNQYILNSTLKAAKLLTQVYSVTGEDFLREESLKTVEYVVKNQRSDGSWPYAQNDHRSWADNYHTGYVLDCLDSFMKNIGDYSFKDSLDRGVKFYVDHFFTDEGAPRFYHNNTYPIDTTSAAQALLTLSRFGYFELADKVAQWTIENMQGTDGAFYFRKHKYFTDKTRFMRWSNAWVFAGLSYYAMKKQSVLNPTAD